MSDSVERELEYWKYLNECRDIIKQYSGNLDVVKNPEEEMSKLYSFVKEVIPGFCVDDGFVPVMHSAYDFIKYDVVSCEQKLSGKFIVESSPIFDFSEKKIVNRQTDVNGVLDYIVHKVRSYLVFMHSSYNRPINIDDLDLENHCIIASSKVKEVCDELSLKSYIVGIYPGYSREADLFDGRGFHLYNVVEIDNEYHLVDCSYRQFFTLKQSLLNRLGIVGLAGCKAGRFMLMNEERKSVANKILKDGWIKLDGDTLKHYLDGFTLSFRNGLYYEQTNDFSYTTSYDADDYIRFLRGEDNQINHEDREVLGYQKKPLKNHKISF